MCGLLWCILGARGDADAAQDTLALGVFDGHSGSEAAQFAEEKLLGHIKVRGAIL